MDAKTIFWWCVAAYYAVIAVRFAVSRLERRRFERMTARERRCYGKYWRGCV